MDISNFFNECITNKITISRIFSALILTITADSNQNIECSYNIKQWTFAGKIYHCGVKHDPKITTLRDTFIHTNNGTHFNGKENKNVYGVEFKSQTVHYFPKIKNFPNLLGFSIERCHLKEVNQWDLKLYPKLKELWLEGNDVQMLAEGLFDFNKELGLVNFGSNKLLHVDLNVFENMPKLGRLLLNSNPCINDRAIGASELKTIFNQVKKKCKHVNELKWKLIAHTSDLDNFRIVTKERIGTFEEKLNQVVDFLLSSDGKDKKGKKLRNLFEGGKDQGETAVIFSNKTVKNPKSS